MSVSTLAVAASQSHVRLVSTDVFDTVLFRDASTETGRLAAACARSAAQLGVNPRVLTRLRWWMQEDAYRAISLERPTGEARLSTIYDVITRGLGLDHEAAGIMRQAEIETDIRHLSANRELLAALEHVAATGTRVIAVSDTYYSAADLRFMIEQVVGRHPIAAIFTSADVGLTKHEGSIYDTIARLEGVPPEAIVHVGDHREVDVVNAERAAWTAVHLPRRETAAGRRRALRARYVVDHVRRLR